ncbi:PREDICTED: uncharacterized protein LOC105962179 [Erythranthe guttata]|uniref:uncharacterized protein LOC105962179 n=1 Tax=Erythranthe guttata TaxID=4155 RepID=UPI00064DBE55|nr:PREDICTED: uncharacterized protein LOC105962179 [Erythranthe guttata]|eukprot:XP_012841926.1 PREDICTED: uncharacterized protein LOC105962179 [Erythranthe guttata]
MYSSAILEGSMHARWPEDVRHSKNAISHAEKPLALKNSLRKRMDLRFWPFVFQYPKYYVVAFMRTSAMMYKNVQDGVFDVSNEWNSRPVRWQGLFFSRWRSLQLKFVDYGEKGQCSQEEEENKRRRR